MTKDPKQHIIDTLSEAPEARFTVLHKRTPLPHGKRQDDGLSDAFVAHLCPERDKPAIGDSGVDDVDIEKAAALARLKEEHASLYGVLFLTEYRGLSLRATGRCLSMDHHTVKKYRGQAVAHVRAWSSDTRQAS